MLALAALIIFIVAAVIGFAHVAGVLFVLSLACVGFACLAAHGFHPVDWRR